MKQLELTTTTRFSLEGHVDARGIRYLGEAALMGDGSWRCLADVGGCLCVVELRLTFTDGRPRPPGWTTT
jgi:hypothetical protein